MLVPLVGFLIACAIFACVGATLLAFIPQFRRTVANVSLFVIGAVSISALAAIAYGQVFADSTGELHGAAILGLYGVLLVAGVCGGLLGLLAYRWLVRTMGVSPKSSSPANR